MLASPGLSNLESQLGAHLDGSGVILLRRSNPAECRVGRVRIGGGEPGMIQSVEGLETELQLGLLGWVEVLEKPEVEFVDAAGANAPPTRGIIANVGAKVLVDAVLDGICSRRHVTVAGKALNAGPRLEGRDVGVFFAA